jgi:hypothetical protein
MRTPMRCRETAALEQFGVVVETSTPDETPARLAGHFKSWNQRMLAFGMKRPTEGRPQ